MATATPARVGPPFRLSVRGVAILIGVLALVLLYATDQIVPATTDRQAEMRFWLAARATGIVAFLLLTFQIVLGLVLSHPTNRSTWNLSKRIFPWHDHLWVFVMAFLVAHIVSLVVDPKAGVSVAGAFIPGLSEYRSSPVAIGTLALYAFLFTAITARWTKLLPRGAVAEDPPAGAGHLGDGLDARRPRRDRHRRRSERSTSGPACWWSVAGAYRYWASRKQKPTFATSRHGGTPRMSITSMRLRRLITTVGVIAALVLGFGSIKAAAAWTAASAPLTVAPVAGLGDPGPPRRRAGPVGRHVRAARRRSPAQSIEMTAALAGRAGPDRGGHRACRAPSRRSSRTRRRSSPSSRPRSPRRSGSAASIRSSWSRRRP